MDRPASGTCPWNDGICLCLQTSPASSSQTIDGSEGPGPNHSIGSRNTPVSGMRLFATSSKSCQEASQCLQSTSCMAWWPGRRCDSDSPPLSSLARATYTTTGTVEAKTHRTHSLRRIGLAIQATSSSYTTITWYKNILW